MKDIIAIIGSHPGTRDQFDFDRTDCDVWIFNEALAKDWCKRADAVFQMHAPAVWKNPQNRNDQGHAQWLMYGDTPVVYMMEQYPEVPKAEKYPYAEICQELLWNFDHEYFSSSVDFAIALAIYKGYPKMEIYGVELETETEYVHQRPGTFFWTGVAVGRGIIVKGRCNMFNMPIYAYEGGINVEYKTFKERAEKFAPIKIEREKDYREKNEIVNQSIHTFVKDSTTQTAKNIVTSIQAMVIAATQYGEADGVIQENERYMKKADTMRENAEGEYLFVRQEFEQAGQALAQARQEVLAKSQALAGQLEMLMKAVKGLDTERKRREHMNDFIDVLQTYTSESMKVGLFNGAMSENRNYMKLLDLLIRAAGGAKSEEAILNQYKMQEIVNV